MKIANSFTTALVMSAFLGALSGCDSNDGPVEKAGKKVDQAAQQAGENIEEAGEKLQDAVQGDEQ